MKKIFTFLVFLPLSFAVLAQKDIAKNKDSKIQAAPHDTSSAKLEALSLKETSFDFGKIPQGKPVTHTFQFTNTGSTAFSLDNVQASCGCTTPEWNKDVIQPGSTAIIKVGYNAQNEGPFTKPVTITYNGNQTKQIIIKGEVWKTPTTSAPENTSLNSLKTDQ